MSDVVKTRREGAILEVTLDRPKANAIDLATSRLLGETFKTFRDDDGLRGRAPDEVPRIMAGVADLKVPLLAEVGFGPNWEQAH